MKKPLILLVDDDRAVLAALEAALRPAFEEIARVETFDDPTEVLAAIPAWEAEQRPIAVAVVDQKMAPMAGTELLVALRRAKPAEHARAILLTGYAGLDSAVAAKNDGAVDRYLEKPWSPARLSETVHDLFARHASESGRSRHYVFREAIASESIREILRLRFSTYSATHLKAFLPTDGSGFDTDAYDPVSRFFGFYEVALDVEQLVGTLRVVENRPNSHGPSLGAIVAEFPALLERLRAPRSEPLPLMRYWPDRGAVRDLYARLVDGGERVVEPSRLAIAPAFRTAQGLSGRHLVTHLIESTTGFFFFLQIANALLTCDVVHARFYEPLGFKPSEGTDRHWIPELQAESFCLHGSIVGVPPAIRGRVLSLTARIRRTSATCLCPTFPECLPGPYETGDFSGTDLFCPLRAREPLAAQPS